jgi:phosphatidyl-myo-inositol dimannoside synthase
MTRTAATARASDRRPGRWPNQTRPIATEAIDLDRAGDVGPARVARRMGHLLVTNDFPPKVGGIQSYLWELWRRLPAERVTVMTTPYANDTAFDRDAPMRIIRTRQRWLLPTPILAKQIREVARDINADLIVLDPAVPVGMLGPHLRRELDIPIAVVLHGAEVAIPGRLPLTSPFLRRVIANADHLIAAGRYPLAEAQRLVGAPRPSTVIPPGVDTERFHPRPDEERDAIRDRLGLPRQRDGVLIVGASRLVPRKGYDTVIAAAAAIAPRYPGLTVAISGSGRDRARLERIAARACATSPLTVRFLGRLSDADLTDLYAAGDVYAMCCRNRWLGLEQEGFGIVFIEASASGVAVLAGQSGGVTDAVVDGVTGLVVAAPVRSGAAAVPLERLVSDVSLRGRLGAAGRTRCVGDLTYDLLAHRLDGVLAELEGRRPLGSGARHL